MCEMACQIVQKKQEEKKIKEEQAANALYWKIPACSDDDDDYNFSITPNKPVDSLIMGDEHLNTIPVMESDEFIKSSVENLVPNPSQSEGENGCDNLCLNMILLSFLLLQKLILFSMSSLVSSLFSLISLGIDETDCHLENEIRLIERLLYDNSSPRPPKEFISENSDAEIESFSPSPILIKDSGSLIEEIDLSFTMDDPMPSGIKEDDDDSERDILIHEELLDNYSLLLPKNESFYFDIPSFSSPLAKPPYGNTRILNIKMMGDISDQKVPMPRLMITHVSNQEKSPDLLSHRGLEFFQLSAKCSMMIHGKNIPILDVPLFHFYPFDQLNILGNLKTLAKGFYPPSLHFFSFNWESFISSSKIDSLLDEFAGELILLKLIPLGIDEANCDPEEEIRLIEKLFYDNSAPRPPEEFISENYDVAIESFSPSPIPVEDSESLRDEINLSLTPDDSMPPGIKDDDYDSEGDILIFE
nr:hypothetical protein [Tanacetum cinerariifolium]